MARLTHGREGLVGVAVGGHRRWVDAKDMAVKHRAWHLRERCADAHKLAIDGATPHDHGILRDGDGHVGGSVAKLRLYETDGAAGGERVALVSRPVAPLT